MKGREIKVKNKKDDFEKNFKILTSPSIINVIKPGQGSVKDNSEDSSNSENEIDIEENSMENFVHYPIKFYCPEHLKNIIRKTGIKQFINHNQHMLHPIGSMITRYISKDITDDEESLNKNFRNMIYQDYSYLSFFDENQIIQLLSLACTAGYYELSQELVIMHIDVNKPILNENRTLLMEATKGGHADIVRLLLSHGANVNAHSTTKNSALIYGCAGGHEEIVCVLLKAGANVQHHNEDGCTPLKAAAKIGHVPIAKILLKHGAMCNVDSDEFKESALTLASYKGHLEMVQLLLEADASQKHDTYRALITASINGHIEVARLLLNTGAQANMLIDTCESPLLLAAWRGHVELAKLLLNQGAKVTEINSNGYNPLMQAARAGHVGMLILLLSQGADINAQNEETGETALTLACCGGFLVVVDYLIKANADINLGRLTALMIAAREGYLDIVKLLIDYNADVQAQTFMGDTALIYACENGRTDIARHLLLFNAKLEHKSAKGVTPLMSACVSGHFDTVQFLLSKGANVNYQTEDGRTPLTLSSMAGHIAIVALLLDHGAKRNHILKDNFTAVMEAATCNQQHTITLLLAKPQIFRTYRYGTDDEFIFRSYFSSWDDMEDKILPHQRGRKKFPKIKFEIPKEKDKN